MQEVTRDVAIDDGELWILEELPGRFVDLYDLGFIRKFLLCAAAVTGRVGQVWAPATSVAEELALRLLLDQTDVIVDTYEVDVPEEWRPALEELLFEDLEHECLYRELPFTEVGAHVETRLANLTAWFIPFDENLSGIPYVTDSPLPLP
ncbi:hypothetical protein ABMA10_00125 [Plantibacter sp. RU18]